MLQIVFFGLAGLSVIYGLFHFNQISKQTLVVFLIVTLIFLISSIYFEYENDKYRDKVNYLKLQFQQDKNISCGNYTVNNQQFNITSNSFVAKQESKNRGLIIPFTNCQF